jgi:hypothetical protein
MLGAVASLVILAWLKLTMFSFISVAACAACAAGIALLQMDVHYPRLLPMAGFGGMVIFGGLAVIYFVKHNKVFGAFGEVVKNVQNVKTTLRDISATAATQTDEILKDQSDFTKKLVAKVKAKL